MKASIRVINTLIAVKIYRIANTKTDKAAKNLRRILTLLLNVSVPRN
jgi:hypothetical protein